MVVVGFAVGLDTVVLLNPVDGVQVYVLPTTLAAPIDADDPLQIVCAEPAAAIGKGLTVTVTLFDLLQPVAVIVSVTV